MKRFCLILAAGLLLAGVLSATTITIDGAGGGDYTTINAGISVAAPGDIILVKDGIYREAVVISGDGEPGNPIVLKAENPRGVVIDGSQPVTGWTRCTSDDAGLTVLGVVNAGYASIFKTEIDSADIEDVYNAILFENSEHLYLSQYPDQVGKTEDVIQDKDHYILVSDEAHGETTFVFDSDFLGLDAGTAPVSFAGTEEPLAYDQPDDYWNDARFVIHSHGINNHIVYMTVTDFNSAAHTVHFTPDLGAPITNGSRQDSYAFQNHPHAISRAGEYYVVPTPVGGKYTIYLWPRNESHLADRISFAVRDRGIYGYSAQHWVVEGFEVTGHTGDGIRFRSNNATDFNTVTVRNCYSHRNVGWGIYITTAYDCVVESCDVYLCGGRGIHLTDGKNSTIRYCSAHRTGTTNMSFYTMKHSSLIGNLIGGAGTHGNGFSAYIHCDSILIANNMFFPSGTGITLQDFGLVAAYGNLFHGPHSGQLLNNWGPSHGRNVGPVVAVHNTIISDNDGSAGAFSVQTLEYDGVQMPVYSFNNIVHGDNSRIGNDNADTQPGVRGNNVYTKYGWTQKSSYGWEIVASEIDARATEMTAVFRDTSARDFHLAAGSPAVGAGTDVSTLLDTLGITGLFPDFDFTRDLGGRTWAATPSAGCFEYTTSAVRAEPAVAGERFSVSPLPFTDRLSVRMPGAVQYGLTVRLYRLDGMLVKTVTDEPAFRTNDLPAGAYWLIAESAGRKQAVRIIKTGE